MASGSGVEVSGKKELEILRTILSEQSNPEDLHKAAEVLKRWSKLNGVTKDKKEGSFPQNWLCESLQEIDQFVENHIPTLPVEGPQGSQLKQLQDFLKSTQSMICHEVLRLTPVLEDTGLLDHLTDSYSRHLFPKLDLLLNRDLSVKETFCLLLWGKYVFFSSDSKLRVYDPLLLTGWFERAKQKLLLELQNDISRTLQNILHYHAQHGHNEDSMDEETFIRLYIDVTQCLNCAILDAKSFGQTFMHAVKILCSEELHGFAQKYVDTENKLLKKLKFTEKNSVYLFRIINTCMELRCFAMQISPDKNNSDNISSIISMLQKLEDKALSIVQKIMTSLAQANLGSYFKKNNVNIDILIEAIHGPLSSSLPPTALEIKMIIVKIAYDCVSKVYLECLMTTKFRKLEKLWGNAENKIKEDVQRFHKKFSELGCQQNQLLQRMSEVLLCSDVEALKITCGVLFRDFPHESEQYVPGLLRWKGVLSEPQVREILDVIRDLYPNHRREQTLEYIESSNQPGRVDLDLIGPDVEASGKKLLDILRKILSEQSNPEDLDKAAEVLKRWSKLNGVTIDKKEGSFPQNWLREYLQEIDQFVENHIPTLPVEGPQGSQLKQLQDFLKSTQSMICHEVLRLTPVLEDTGLLDHLIDSYSRHLFPKLDLLLNRDLSVKETFCLLLWGKEVFFSPDSQHVFRVYDPLLLTGWFEKAIKKLLPLLKNDITKTLQNILQYDEQHGHNEESMGEESFIRVHIDVTQYLNAVLTNSEAFSKTLMCTAQNLCLKELHCFVQKYVDAEKKHLKNWQPLNTNSVYLFRVISTCRQLRFYAPQLNNPDINNSEDLLNICSILTDLEDHVLSIAQKMMKHLAQDSLRRYFKKDCEQIHTLTEAIQKQCASLPQDDVGKEIREIFVIAAYDCVSRVYLNCLMKSKIKRLEKRWGNVGERMREDALNFHNTFTELRVSDDHGNQLLQRLSEVVLCNDVDALKVTCVEFPQIFQKDSEHYVPGLLRWKGVSERQRKRHVGKSFRDYTSIVTADVFPNCTGNLE
ncbi:unnamed protein product [Leuciscus chuanchicus]